MAKNKQQESKEKEAMQDAGETEITQADIDAEATHMAAMQIAEIETDKALSDAFVGEEKTQEERERLIAEAYRMMGRVEGLNVTTKFVTVTSLMLLRQVKETKIYKDIPDIGTWENYCKSMGFSREKVDKDLENLATFGEDFLVTVTNLGVGYRELRTLKKSKTDGALSISGDNVVIEGEIIPMDNKELLKEALEEHIAKQQAEIKELRNESVAKDKSVKEYSYLAEKAKEDQEKAEKERDGFKNRLQSIYQGRLGDVPNEDREKFQDIANIEIDFNKLMLGLRTVDDNTLSDFTAKMLCGVVSKMMIEIDNVRQELEIKYSYHFDGGILTKDELDTLPAGDTPAAFLKEDGYKK